MPTIGSKNGRLLIAEIGDIPIYEWLCSWQEQSTLRYLSKGESMPFVQKGTVAGVFNYSTPGVMLPIEMFTVPDKYFNINAIGDLSSGNYLDFYCTPISYTMEWALSKSNHTLQTSARNAITLYEPEFKSANFIDQSQDVCRTGVCELPKITLNGYEAPAVTRATITYNFSAYDRILSTAVPNLQSLKQATGRTANVGVNSISLALTVERDNYELDEGELYEVELPASLTEFWEFNWFRFLGVGNVAVSPATAAIVSSTLNFEYSGLNDSMTKGSIVHPSGSNIYG